MLSDEQNEVVNREIELLKHISSTLDTIDAEEEDKYQVQQSIEHLQELFMLVVVGEFNSGKSTFLNALLGDKYLAFGATPTTSKVDIMRFGERVRETASAKDKGVRELYLPVSWLKQMSLVDTPGTNAVIENHQAITEHFIPRSDMVLFITSSDRPFSQSERQFLEMIRTYKKKIVFVLSKIDILDPPDEIENVKAFVIDSASKYLHFEPLIFPVSSKRAIAAKRTIDKDTDPSEVQKLLAKNPKWEESQFGALEDYILNTLDSSKRFALKVRNPLGVAAKILDKYTTEMEKVKETLDRDKRALDTVAVRITEFKEEMMADFHHRCTKIDLAFQRMQERGLDFIEKTVRLSNMADLVSGDKVKTSFELNVVGSTVKDIDDDVSDIIDWLLKKTGKKMQEIVTYLNAHNVKRLNKNLQVGTAFEYDRESLLASIGASSSRILDTYDRTNEADKVNAVVKSSIYQFAAFEIAGVGLGTVLSSSLFDLTGIVPATVVAGLGLAILPYTRMQMKRELCTRIDSLRSRLKDSLQSKFEVELDDQMKLLNGRLQPFADFVKEQEKKVEVIGELIATAVDTEKELRELIDKQYPQD